MWAVSLFANIIKATKSFLTASGYLYDTTDFSMQQSFGRIMKKKDRRNIKTDCNVQMSNGKQLLESS